MKETIGKFIKRMRHRCKESTINAESGIILDLAEFLGQPIAEVRDKVIYCREFRKSESERTSDGWLYDIAQFNSYDSYEERLAPLGGLVGRKLLDYGCGIGTAVLRLSHQNKVVGYDINPKLIEFARYRAIKRGLINATFITEEPDLSQFDIITFIDVLEHFEDLHTFMCKFGARLKRGTPIYHYNSFKHRILAHYDHSAEWSGILDDAGFIPFNPLWSIKI